MLIESKEVDRLVSLIGDIRAGRLPSKLAKSSLLAFFVENPHLLMTESFDEHMQSPLQGRQREILGRVPEDTDRSDSDYYDPELSFGMNCQIFPNLEFRTHAGRWAALVWLPNLENRSHEGIPADAGVSPLIFSFQSRQILKEGMGMPEPGISEEMAWEDWDKFDDYILELYAELHLSHKREELSLPLDKLITELREKVRRPRESSLVLWSPRFWVPREQERQRALLDASLAPHMARWMEEGICFDDLNFSEFEDLVGEVLFAAGMRIHKVREVPQGGRDLIARGCLIPNEEPIEIAVEVKHRRIVDRPLVQRALYQNRAYPALMFVTSGRFTAGVFEEKAREENRFRLFLKDGLALGDLIRCHFKMGADIRSR